MLQNTWVFEVVVGNSILCNCDTVTKLLVVVLGTVTEDGSA